MKAFAFLALFIVGTLGSTLANAERAPAGKLVQGLVTEVKKLQSENQKLRSLMVQPRNDDCIDCVREIAHAVNICNELDTSTLECVENSIGAASDCLRFVCDILDVIDGGDGICPEDDDGTNDGTIVDCATCAVDIDLAIKACNDDDNSTLLCVENILGTVSDCLVCICEIAGAIGNEPITGCDPDYPL
ncbi:hypothetical protein TCAL_11694 [Tigriopus californicus]|uniref:Saposin B-type domain-containing protein n=1 Tax=Tigriopus californicus TaxID=6832 RepID=A0A553PLJ6_TIGCA|nr:uncharacterized protein LOC131890160 [Tigriopus californicus]TRY78557.1 hypothetical protein TCAL_11694 [Tigriopus californicus]|eukprot:TCALIF_11694-PA protein Name:"Protein of unknown function" AED:0.02 eAED:0.02 QI:19/1/0.75/1/1/1/4/168/188